MGCCGAATRVETLGKDGPPVELPCKERSIRDIPCLIIFALFLVGGVRRGGVRRRRGKTSRGKTSRGKTSAG